MIENAYKLFASVYGILRRTYAQLPAGQIAGFHSLWAAYGTVGELGGLALAYYRGIFFTDQEPSSSAGIAAIAGILIYAGTRVFELIRPWTYDN
jgi:hypothetical protein